ncbi:hypothetical protein [Pacificoceanicola onchidii]|uniref:hypothetical protein n=1 Tax=Pacificoceanicola onchidii TaxID=2562685 RepID=UPI0010A5AC91|nr:hypothetical protein [Pacificoceanicola onchidii]
MTSYEAHEQLNAAIATLRQVRDTLGKELCPTKGQLDMKNPEIQRLSNLHDRAAMAISAWHKGV